MIYRAFRPPLAVLALSLVLAGCGTPSESLNMTLAPVDVLQMRSWVPELLKGNVELDAVSGGQPTSRWWGSKVGNVELGQALEDSLRSLGLLPLGPPARARFQLSARVLALDAPWIAANMTVNASIHYSLLDKLTGQVLYERSVRNRYTASFFDAMISQPERTRLANEGAVRENIQMAMRDLFAVRSDQILRIEPPMALPPTSAPGAAKPATAAEPAPVVLNRSPPS